MIERRKSLCCHLSGMKIIKRRREKGATTMSEGKKFQAQREKVLVLKVQTTTTITKLGVTKLGMDYQVF